MNTFLIPKYLTFNDAFALLRNAEMMFACKEKARRNVQLDLSRVERTDILGLLLIYKFVEYSAKNHCFLQPLLLYNDVVEMELKRYGFYKMLDAFMSNKDASYEDLDFHQEGNSFFFAPIVLSSDMRVEEKNRFLPRIQQFYYFHSLDKAASMVLTTIGEIILNFKEHAVDDTESVIAVAGNLSDIQIACADTGLGIYSTLSPYVFDKRLKSREKVLSHAMKRGVTSKQDSYHMGSGLWIIDEFARRTGGRLHVYSEGAYYMREHGKKISGPCSYWKGTIIYVSLPLNNVVTLSDLSDIQTFNNINLNIK